LDLTIESAVQPDAGMLLAGLHDERELPFVPVYVAHLLQQFRARRNRDAGPMEQACGHVLVSRQPQRQSRRTGHREPHHPHHGRESHLVQRAVNHVVVLVEHHVGRQAAELALEGEQIVGQRQNGDLMTEGTQHLRHVTDHVSQVRGAAAILRRIRNDPGVRVVYQRHVKGFPGSSGPFRHILILVFQSVMQGRLLSEDAGGIASHDGLARRRRGHIMGPSLHVALCKPRPEPSTTRVEISPVFRPAAAKPA
jgi:hypothetical protein